MISEEDVKKLLSDISLAKAEVEWEYPINYAVMFDKIEELCQMHLSTKVNKVDTPYYRMPKYYCPTCGKQQKSTHKTLSYGCFCERCGQKLSPFG